MSIKKETLFNFIKTYFLLLVIQICAVLTPAVGMHISSYIPPAMTPEEIEMCNKFTSFEDWEADLKRRHQEQLQELAAVEVRLDKMTDDMRRIKWNKTVAEAIKLKDHPEHGPEMHQWYELLIEFTTMNTLIYSCFINIQVGKGSGWGLAVGDWGEATWWGFWWPEASS